MSSSTAPQASVFCAKNVFKDFPTGGAAKISLDSVLHPDQSNNYIVIWNQEGERLLSIRCRRPGRKWIYVALFLKTICGEIDFSGYDLMKGDFRVDNLTESSILEPDFYKLIAKNTSYPALWVKYNPLPIIPVGRLSKKTSEVTTPTEGIPSRPMRAENFENALLDYEKDLSRKSTFKERIIQRDQHCIITKKYISLKASHIVAHAWWINNPERRERLPEDVKTVISNSNDNIDDITNGILLEGTLADSFDRGEFSLFYSGEKCYVVALVPALQAMDGFEVDRCCRKRNDGTIWWCEENRPHPTLLEFHLRNSIFANCRGAAEPEEFDDTEEEDRENIRNAFNFLHELYDNPQVGSKIAQFLLEREEE